MSLNAMEYSIFLAPKYFWQYSAVSLGLNC